MSRDFERDLISFWSSSPGYYETAQRLNADYGDADHAEHRRLLAELVERKSRAVLDVGCGTGEFAVALVASSTEAEYVGVDVSTQAPELAADAGRPGRYLTANAAALPIEDASFDAVVSLFALEHFTDPVAVLGEMVRVLRPGGFLGILSVSYDRPLHVMPSIRLGLGGVARRHPANLAVYALNRLRFAVRQTWKRVRSTVDRSYMSFEIVEPLVLRGGSFEPDLDAAHVVSGRSVVRLLERLGMAILETNDPPGRWPVFHRGFGFHVYAQRR